MSQDKTVFNQVGITGIDELRTTLEGLELKVDNLKHEVRSFFDQSETESYLQEASNLQTSMTVVLDNFLILSFIENVEAILDIDRRYSKLFLKWQQHKKYGE
jgi:hypothetical protein